MEITSINSKLLARMFLAGAKNLDSKKDWINELNVFPVPDGDTGTNMTMTIMSAAKEVSSLTNPTMAELAKAISSGSLRGARGNSRVILSQLFRGFCKVIKEYDEIDVTILCEACQKAVETAYKAVMKPKEGTILTVAKGAAEKALELSDETEDVVTFVEEVIKQAEYVLDQTPEMLPVLKEAGVVDSGGQGLVEVLRGAILAYEGNPVALDDETEQSESSAKTSGAGSLDNVEIKFGYCTEFIIMLDKKFDKKDELGFKAYLESIGDSIVVVADDEIVKVHVHTNDPGLAIQKALTYGSLSRMKIDNMREEHQEKLIKDAEKLAKEQEEKEAAEAALKQAQAEIERLKAQQNQEQPKPEETLKVGDTVTSGNVKYRVIDAQKKLAEAYGVDSRRARTLKVAAAVTISGEKVSVTSIAANAFKGMKKLEKVTIGTNVSRIGKNAFSGDGKLKSIQIKSKKLTSVGKKALKNISAKAVIKVPKSKKKAYTSLLKGKGQKKSVKIK